MATTGGSTRAETLRIASFNIELVRDGPGLALRDILSGTDPQIQAIVAVVNEVDPDILAVQGLDFDYGRETLDAFANLFGTAYPHRFSLPTNRGRRTGLDLDGDGRADGAADAQGFGRFYGQAALAVLSRFPIAAERAQDFTDMLWQDFPGAQQPTGEDGQVFPSREAASIQRLSSSGHWVVPIEVSKHYDLTLLTFHASPPVFDGPEDRNGRRNADEIGFWKTLLNGALGRVPSEPFVIAASANLDPFDSDGRHAAIRELLQDPRLQDSFPSSQGARTASHQNHLGDNAHDTVDWPDVGRLRVDYVLPSATIEVVGSGVFWPQPGHAGHDIAVRASRHRLVWVDLVIPTEAKMSDTMRKRNP